MVPKTKATSQFFKELETTVLCVANHCRTPFFFVLSTPNPHLFLSKCFKKSGHWTQNCPALNLCLCDVNFLPLSSLGPKSHSLKCKLNREFLTRRNRRDKKGGRQKQNTYLETGLSALYSYMFVCLYYMHVVDYDMFPHLWGVSPKLICKRAPFS